VDDLGLGTGISGVPWLVPGKSWLQSLQIVKARRLALRREQQQQVSGIGWTGAELAADRARAALRAKGPQTVMAAKRMAVLAAKAAPVVRSAPARPAAAVRPKSQYQGSALQAKQAAKGFVFDTTLQSFVKNGVPLNVNLPIPEPDPTDPVAVAAYAAARKIEQVALDQGETPAQARVAAANASASAADEVQGAHNKTLLIGGGLLIVVVGGFALFLKHSGGLASHA